jgi:hypothetical protein
MKMQLSAYMKLGAAELYVGYKTRKLFMVCDVTAATIKDLKI